MCFAVVDPLISPTRPLGFTFRPYLVRESYFCEHDSHEDKVRLCVCVCSSVRVCLSVRVLRVCLSVRVLRVCLSVRVLRVCAGVLLRRDV